MSSCARAGTGDDWRFRFGVAAGRYTILRAEKSTYFRKVWGAPPCYQGESSGTFPGLRGVKLDFATKDSGVFTDNFAGYRATMVC